ncbi:G-D-S-L family lipolytic protein [Brasilonema octagenarum UFV-OR1]|uniref:G-D-S-L family lipolytic protein n=1 Tax=Brasilonema octagenarum UFV-OR1 TaxID=417115 RepID=A0ABX1M1G9_9CYAN|nr:GDSL-type esterase/lipase family protein [Brasilonema octagenarum]NMF62329.1 G-D-S-L family lipolytic protein [Brasilonema octagenarum UFV-OR1]
MNNTIVILFFLSLLLNLFFLLLVTVFLARRGGVSYLSQKILPSKSAQNNYSVYYLHKKSQFEILPKSDSGIIFLGDSLTDEGEWGELLENPNLKNRGISADTTDSVLNRLNAVVASKPKKLFLMIGINDFINAHKSVEQTLTGYKQILTELRNQTPNTKVFLQSVLPVNNQVTRYWQDNKNVWQLNLQLREVAKEFSYEYIDVFSHLSDSQNQLDTRYTQDGLHLNGQGYLMWKQAIEKYVKE